MDEETGSWRLRNLPTLTYLARVEAKIQTSCVRVVSGWLPCLCSRNHTAIFLVKSAKISKSGSVVGWNFQCLCMGYSWKALLLRTAVEFSGAGGGALPL